MTDKINVNNINKTEQLYNNTAAGKTAENPKEINIFDTQDLKLAETVLDPDVIKYAETLASREENNKIEGEAIAETLYSSINGIGTKKDDYFTGMNSINSKNITVVLKSYNKKSPNESLVKAMFNEYCIRPKTKIAALKIIQAALMKRAVRIGADVTLLNEKFQQEIDNATTGMLAKLGYVDTDGLDAVINQYLERLEAVDALNKASQQKYVESNALVAMGESTEIWYKEHLEEPMTYENIVGDGKIPKDNQAIQKTGNCWAHAAINALAANPVTREMLNNLISKNSYVVSVKLQEAANKGLPKPKGDGIYSFSEADLTKGFKEQSLGDGDVTAIMMAVNQYFTEIGENPERSSNNMDGNLTYRMLEILLGKKAELNLDYTISDGIKVATPTGNIWYFKNLEKMIMNKEGIAIVNFIENANNQQDNPDVKLIGNAVLHDGHSYAITDIDKSCVYLRDSNHSEGIIKMGKKTFVNLVMSVATFKP